MTVLAAGLFYIPSFISLPLLAALTNVVPFTHKGIRRYVHCTHASVFGVSGDAASKSSRYLCALRSFTSATGQARHGWPSSVWITSFSQKKKKAQTGFQTFPNPWINYGRKWLFLLRSFTAADQIWPNRISHKPTSSLARRNLTATPWLSWSMFSNSLSLSGNREGIHHQ